VLRALAIVAVISFWASTAAAQGSAQSAAATAQFDKGRNLMKEKKYGEACAAFEQSQKLEAQFGTQFNLADCYGHMGKLASAWVTYKELSQRDTNDGRKKEAARRAKELDKRLPRLLLKAASPPAGLTVTMNGNDATSLIGIDSPVDLGDYKIHAKAPGYTDFDSTAKIVDEGKTVTVAIELDKGSLKGPDKTVKVPEKTPEKTPAKTPERTAEGTPAGTQPTGEDDGQRDTAGAAPKSHRKTYAVIAGAAGIALVATGLVFGNIANGKWSDAKKLCGDDLTCDNANDLAQGNKLVSDAKTNANISTGLFIGGAAAVAVGAVLWFTAPSAKPSSSTALRVTPHAGPDGVGVTLGARF
jgi:hypothetical protein